MAENIYSKGTRVWFPDKELGWISAEVTSASKTDDAVKLVFTDERGKVQPSRHASFPHAHSSLLFPPHRKSRSIPP